MSYLEVEHCNYTIDQQQGSVVETAEIQSMLHETLEHSVLKWEVDRKPAKIAIRSNKVARYLVAAGEAGMRPCRKRLSESRF